MNGRWSACPLASPGGAGAPACYGAWTMNFTFIVSWPGMLQMKM